MEETKIIYHIDEEDTPYLIKLSVPADRVTLGDFKNALNRPNYKFYFKSMDDDFGVVKEEILEDETPLPCFNGRVVSWLVSADSTGSDGNSDRTESQSGDLPPLPGERLGGIGDSRPPSFHANTALPSRDPCDTCTETDSVASRPGMRGMNGPHNKHLRHVLPPHHPHNRNTHGFDATSSVMSSDLDATSFFDSEDDASSRYTTQTESQCSKYARNNHRRRRRRHRMPPISRASSFSSITDSTMSLNIITVTLNMDTVNFLGISIVGQSNKAGDGGIYVGSIMKGGAVAQDGRIEPGDMILEVNGVSFENMSNDDAVRTLREAVQKPGPVTLVVAKCWDPNPKGYFTIPRQEPVRPIDPSAWVAHTNAMQMRPEYRSGGSSVTLSTATSTNSSLNSSLPESERFENLNLTVNTDMVTVVKAMSQPDSGLEIRDRMWLKITIPNAFIGSDLVDWLHTHVEGFADRRDARKYATNLLKAGYIKHTVNKLTFSEQCYYVFGDQLCGDMSSLTLEDIDSVSEVDRDTLGPLPGGLAWSNQNHYNPYGPTSYMPPPPAPMPNYAPPPTGAGGGGPGTGGPAAPQGGVPLQPHQPPHGGMPGTKPSYLPPGPLHQHGPHGMHHVGPPYMNDTASYVSMPGANGSVVSYQSGSAQKGKSCACLVSHTYKQIKRLWDPTKDKPGQDGSGQPAGKCAIHPHGYMGAGYAAGGRVQGRRQLFAEDMDRSTSSSDGSSASGSSDRRQRGGGSGGGGSGGDKSSDKKSSLPSHSDTGSETETGGSVVYPGGPMMNSGPGPDPNTLPSYARVGAMGGMQAPGGPPLPTNNGTTNGPQNQSNGDSTGGSGDPNAPASHTLPPGPPPPGQLADTNAELASSRQSFKMAMGNPSQKNMGSSIAV